jgi:hypothetical protein
MPPMNLRLITVAVALLYALLAGPGLVGHHHAHGAAEADRDCATCAWLLGAVADLPLLAVATDRPVSVRMIAADSSVALPAFFAVATASRAPPEVLA